MYRGVVEGAVLTHGPSHVVMRWYDAGGRQLGTRRIRDRRYSLTLPVGDYRIGFSDERSNEDASALAPTWIDVAVRAGGATRRPVRLVRGAVIRAEISVSGKPARFARVLAVHEDGTTHDVRADGSGRITLGALARGRWQVSALDSRRSRSADPVEVTVDAGDRHTVALDLHRPTGAAMVHLTGMPSETVLVDRVTAVHRATGRCRVARVDGGLALLTGLEPGHHDLVIPASHRHQGQTHDLGIVDSDVTSTHSVALQAGPRLVGRVVDPATGRGCLDARVILLDAAGNRLLRTRCDARGWFSFGSGLSAADELTVEVTSGPESISVSRTAVADVDIRPGVWRDLGTILLARPAIRSAWSAPAHAISAMKLPTTRV